MELGFVIPDFWGEKRVALLPEHIRQGPNSLKIECGFGRTMHIPDSEYINRGCQMCTRSEIFNTCNIIFSLKLIQPPDYEALRKGQMIIGWTHPTSSGKDFMREHAVPKQLIIVDLDNVYPRIYRGTQYTPIPWIPRNFIWKNSWLAGYAAVHHALECYGLLLRSEHKVAVLSAGNVAQGAFAALSNYGTYVRMFTRKTMAEFKSILHQFDVVVNGIEMDKPGEHILNQTDLARMKSGALIIDAAADAGNTIEGTRYTRLHDPIYEKDGLFYYVVENAPTLLYREASMNISQAFSEYVYFKDIAEFCALANTLNGE